MRSLCIASVVSSARSIPDAMAACQDWGARRFEMMAEEAKHVLNDTQKFMQMGAHILASGFGSKSLCKGLGRKQLISSAVCHSLVLIDKLIPSRLGTNSSDWAARFRRRNKLIFSNGLQDRLGRNFAI
jgi:hypothetical protein